MNLFKIFKIWNYADESVSPLYYNAIKEELERFSLTEGLTFTTKGMLKEPSIFGNYGGLDYNFFILESGNDLYSHIAVGLPCVPNFSLNLCERDFFDTAEEIMDNSLKEIKTGKEHFDIAYLIKTNAPSQINSLVSDDIKEDIMDYKLLCLFIEGNNLAAISNFPTDVTALYNDVTFLSNIVTKLAKGMTVETEFENALNTGMHLNSEGRFSEAVPYFDKALKAEPDSLDVLLNKSNALFSLAKYEEATECLNSVLKVKSDHAPAWYRKGLLLNNLDRQVEAIECFDRALEIKPDFTSALVSKGDVLYELEEFEVAILCFEKAIELKPDIVTPWLRIGIVLYNNDEYDDALEYFNQVLNIDEENIQAYYYAGNIFHNMEHYDDAIICFDSILELDPQNTSAWEAKGAALNKKQKFKEARECFDKARII